MDGIILKALSGFYYVDVGAQALIACRARGKFRHQKITPLVGDRVSITVLDDGTGMVDEIYPRTSVFQRPAVANIEQLIIIASAAIPVTDPFLIDRMISIAESRNCEPVVCINKSDLAPGDELRDIYSEAGVQTLCVSAKTGEGIEELRQIVSGKVSAFTGNSGVGKSSILNSLQPDLGLQVGEVSERLGRGRHTTRHVELLRLDGGGAVADTPGFSSFDVERMELIRKEELAHTFREFRPYLDDCRFVGCTHRKEKGCAVLSAVCSGAIPHSRHDSYLRLYEQVSQIKEWEISPKG